MDIRYFNKKGKITFSDFNNTKPMTVKTEVDGTEHSFEFTERNVISLINHLDRYLLKKIKAEQHDL